MHSGSNSEGKWDTFLSQALCVNPFVVPSLIKCHCPDYPAVRQTSKWASSDGRERGGGGGVFEWDAHWPCHHHKPPVWSNILTGWMSGWLGTYQANSPQLQSLFQHQRLSTYTTQSLVVNGGWTTLRGWCLCPDKIWNKSKSSSEMLLATLDQSSHVDTHIPARRA